MENTRIKGFNSYIKERKHLIIGGVKTGVYAFVLAYIVSIIMATIAAICFWESLTDITQGNIGGSREIIVVTIIKVTTLIMNLSVFNTIGIYNIGIVILGAVTMIPLFIANRSYNKEAKASTNHLIVYFISSFIFSVLLMLMAFIGKGELLGFNINYFSFKNFIFTIIITMAMQLVIGINYHKDVPTSVGATRIMIRLLYGVSALFGIVSMVQYPTSLIKKIIAVIGLLPNVMVYRSLMFIGVEAQASETVLKAFDKISFRVGLAQYPSWLLYATIALFIGMTIFACMKINRERFLIGNLLFSIYFAIFMVLLTYCSSVNLGDVPLFSYVSLGANYLSVFLVPFITINAVALVIYLIRRIKSILSKELDDE